MRAKAIVAHAPEPVTLDNWLDMRVGERNTVTGKLAHVGYGAPGSILIDFGDLSQLVIECDRPRDTTPIPLGSQVHVRVIRTEDGLKAGAMWMEGSVPIPLMTRC